MLNKNLCIISVSVLLTAACVGLAGKGLSSVPQPVHLAQAAGAPRYEEATILLHRMAIIDGSKPNSHAWQMRERDRIRGGRLTLLYIRPRSGRNSLLTAQEQLLEWREN